MKVTVNKQDSNKEIEYPCLMIDNDGYIVLFTEKNIGFCLRRGNNNNGKPYYGSMWNMDTFKLFHGAVILEND